MQSEQKCRNILSSLSCSVKLSFICEIIWPPSSSHTNNVIIVSRHSSSLVVNMVKILMRADTHVSFSVPAEEPVAKCTTSQANNNMIIIIIIVIVQTWIGFLSELKISL